MAVVLVVVVEASVREEKKKVKHRILTVLHRM